MTSLAMIQLTTIFQKSCHRSKDFLDLEKEYQEMLAKETQLAVAHWLSGM